MIRRPPRSTQSRSSAASDVYKRQEIWDLVKRGQAAAFAAAKLGAACEDVDAAPRKVYAEFGFGPDYKLPGLPHRTGHGIGMDGHEWTNFVRGNKTKLAPGMCFSNEPMVVVPGEFGVRIEDCIYTVSYTHLRAHETRHDLVCRLLLEKK